MMEVDGVSVLLDIMDTAGQDGKEIIFFFFLQTIIIYTKFSFFKIEYKSLRDHYMKNGEGFIIVF